MKYLTTLSIASAAIALLAAQPANAAFLGIDDFSTEGSIIFHANDFEAGLQVNGSQVQSGLGNPTNTTVSEGPDGSGNPIQNSFSAVWILGGPIVAQNETIFFTEGAGGGISDVLHYTYTQDSSGFGHLDGFVISDLESTIDPSFLSGLGITATRTIAEDGAFDFSNTNITAQFQSDPAEVPEPASLALLGVGLVGLGFARRKRS